MATKILNNLLEENKKRITALLIIAVIMIGAQVINSLSGNMLNSLGGIRPRSIDGMQGIIFSAWLHGSWSHLFSNLPVLMVLGWFVMLTFWRRVLFINIFVILIGDFITWLFGRSDTIVVGASGWVLGLWAFLLSSAILHRRFRDIFIAVIVFIFYSGLSVSLWPKSGVSFAGHWGGAAAGIMCAWCIKNSYRKYS